mgnify:CR=1 FL=1
MSDEEKFRVLIVDDIAETRENIKKLLQFENDIEVVGAARSGHEGIDLAVELRPDVILMDINMPDMDGIATTETIRQKVPYAQIIILTVQSDPNYMRRAMMAGARDYLTKPPAVDEMISAIKRAGRFAHEERTKLRTTFFGATMSDQPSISGAFPFRFGKVIAIYSPKGGAGATTIAVNLAIALHSKESPTLLIDGDMQFGDVAVFINQPGKNNIADLTPRADELDFDIVEEVTLCHNDSGLKILSAPSRPELSDTVTGEQFTKVLEFLRNMYAFIVVDCSSYLSDVTLMTIDVADLIVLLTTQEITAIKDARLFLDILAKLKIGKERLLFVMNKFDRRIGITPEKIEESFKKAIDVIFPYEEKVVLPSINRGVPFILGDKSRAITKSVITLRNLIRERFIEKEDSNGKKKAVPIRVSKH